nr:MAG TPA: hypothetical protein [Caudoviricetes sp.]
MKIIDYRLDILKTINEKPHNGRIAIQKYSLCSRLVWHWTLEKNIPSQCH